METINTRKNIEADLADLKRKIYRMGHMSGNSLEKAIYALKYRNTEVARELINADDLIDDLEEDIDNSCMEFTARYQPLGEDLRIVTSIMHIAVDLERVGDYGVNIAKVAIRTADKEPLKPLIDIPRMVVRINDMINMSLTAIDTNSPQTAIRVFQMDDEVDDLEIQIMRELFCLIVEKPERLEQSFGLMNVSRALERAGDHMTNVAERIIYMYTGKIAKASQYRRKI